MLTWITLWPFMSLPFLFPFLLGILPTFTLAGKELGGPFVRQYLVNKVAAVLPYDLAVQLVNWFTQASVAEELLLHALMSLNIGLLFYPLFYALGIFFIKTTAWRVRTELSQRQSILNRR